MARRCEPVGCEKDRLIEEEDRGWYSVSRRMVCSSCVSDDYLSQYIEQHGKPVACDYCGDDPEDTGLHCLPFDDLMSLIGDGINWAYSAVDNENIPYDQEEGGYAFGKHIFNTYELLTDVIGIDVVESVLKDILRALSDQLWCRQRFFSLSLGDALRSGWEQFVEQVKYETRFLFTLPEPPKSDTITNAPIETLRQPEKLTIEERFSTEDMYPVSSADPEFEIDYDLQEGIPVSGMLDAIAQVVRRLELLRTVPTGTKFFRVRVADKGKVLKGPEDFGPPSRDRATQPNRMSPAGIVMFYGALNGETALAETFQPDKKGADRKNVWIARFEAVRDLRMLDLTELPLKPSLFDAGRRDLIDGIAFLCQFADDLVQPVERDGHEHIEYVPTQIVTEYFRHRFRSADDQRLDGIFYRSSKSRNEGVACVLFISGDNCGVAGEPWQGPDRVLSLLEAEVELLDGTVAAKRLSA